MTTWHGYRTSALLALLAGVQVLGCAGKSVDVGGDSSGPTYANSAPPAKGSSSAAPFRLVSGEAGISTFAVDSGRLYWIASDQSRAFANQSIEYRMRRCEIAACSETLVSWPLLGPNDSAPISLSVVGGRLQWLSDGVTLSSCDVEDCTQQPQVDIGTNVRWFAADTTGTVLVAGVGGMYTCTANDCQNALSRLTPAPPPGEGPFISGRALPPVLDGDYVYASDDRIVRFRRDGSTPFEIIANEPAQELSVQGESVIWRSQSDNSLKSCPKLGCTDPQVLVSGLTDGTQLVADAQFVYFSNFTDPQGNSLLRVPTAGGEGATLLLDTRGGASNLRLNDENLYFLGADCDMSGPLNTHCANISVIPK